MQGSRPLPGLDGLRGLAAGGVLIAHVWLFTGGRADPSASLDSAVNELRVSVTLFFVLSAFLLAQPWVRGGRPRPIAFWTHRAARIVPAFGLSVAAAWWVSRGTWVDPGAHRLWWFSIFAYDQVEGLVPLNPPLWSLAVEVSFYAVLPLLGLWVRARGRAAALAALLVAVSLAWSWAVVRHGGDPRVVRALPTFLGTFGLGIAAADLSHRRPPRRATAQAMLVLGAILVLANALWHGRGAGTPGAVVRDLPAALGFALIVAALAHRPPGLLDWHPLRVLGVLSYGLYVYHWPVMFWLRDTGRMPRDTAGGVVVVGGLSLAVALASYVLVERPVVRRARRAMRQRRSACASGSIAVSGNSSSVPQRTQIAS